MAGTVDRVSLALTEDYQVRCVEAIDSLQSTGIGHFIDLPQMVLVGDQSSGKSSLLDAIINARVPAQDGLCTRFPTQIVMRRGDDASIIANIVPAPDRSGQTLTDIQNFSRSIDSLDQLPGIMSNAARLMGVDQPDRRFCTDALRIEFTGPECLNLSLIDLPGLFLTGGRQQKDEDVTLVRDLVSSYISRPRTIILAVVSAKTERVNQNALGLVKQYDPQGERTLGIITKPDYLGSATGRESYLDYISLLKNEDHKLQLDWHVVKNRGEGEDEFTSQQRNASEAAFFSQADWLGVPDSKKGIASLNTRLCQLHFDIIKDSIPGLIVEADRAATNFRTELTRLPEGNTEMQRSHLALIGQDFTSAIKQCLTNRNTAFGDVDLALRR